MTRRARSFAALDLDPGKPPPSVIERAYQLAHSGKFADVEEICRRLRSDGYRELYLQFEGHTLRAELSRACRKAQGLRKPSKGKPPRSTPSRAQRAQRFELKAVECRQIANNAQNGESRQMYLQLALSYEEAAARENERQAT
jgi:hypothetical protein